MKNQTKNQIMLMALEVGIITALAADWLVFRPCGVVWKSAGIVKKYLRSRNKVNRKADLKKSYLREVEFWT